MCLITDAPDGFDVKPVREKLDAWCKKSGDLTLNDVVQWHTADCFYRATEYLKNKWGVLVTLLNFTEGPVMSRARSALDAKSFKPKIVAVKADGFFAGATSKFKGFHYVLIIATGRDSKGREFCVVYDPDVSATPKSSGAWDKCTSGKKLATDTAADDATLKTMLLGENNELGALIRYYYET